MLNNNFLGATVSVSSATLNATATATGSAVYVGRGKQVAAYCRHTIATGTPSSVTWTLQFSNLPDGTFHDYEYDDWANQVVSSAKIASTPAMIFYAPVVAPYARLTVSAVGSDGTAIFEVTGDIEARAD